MENRDYPQVAGSRSFVVWKTVVDTPILVIMSQQGRKYRTARNNPRQQRIPEQSANFSALLDLHPGELIANIPGLLGFYPEESLVVQGFYSKPDGNAEIGPTVRVDLSAELPCTEIIRYLDNAECSFYLGFIITAEASVDPGPEGISGRQHREWYRSLTESMGADSSALQACWIVDETRQGANYHLLLDSTAEQDSSGSGCWQSGEVASVTAAPAMRPWRQRNELPSLTRREAFAYLLGDDPDRSEAERAERTRRVQWIADAPGGVLGYAASDADDLLAGISYNELTAEDLQKEEDILEKVGTWLSRTSLRDEVLEPMVSNPLPAQELLIATARSLTGKPRANALAILAVVFLELGKNLNASQALTEALDEDPGHNLSQLLFAAISARAEETALAAIKQGIQGR